MRSWLIYVVVFVASGAILVLEIVAGRIMAPYVGVTLQSFTAIIGTVLAAIALGAWAGGAIADRSDAASALGPVLAIGGVLSVASPSFVYVVGPNLVGSSAIQTIVLAAVGFFAPAAVLAMVTPLAAKVQLTNLDDAGSVVGNLSAVGTAGALFGTFVTGFLLIAALPSRPITWVVGAVLLILAVNVAVPATRRWVLVGAVVLAVSVFGSAAVAGTCETESAYYCVKVTVDSERPTGRTLVLDTSNHSYVDVEDPTYLGFRYARVLASVVGVETEDGFNALFIGGGGFTLPRHFEAVHGATSTVLELDPTLVDVAEERLGLVQGDWLRIEIGDARLTLRGEESGSYDVVVGDAFSSLAVPWHLTTQEFLEEVKGKLTADGLYVMNVIDRTQARFVHAELQTLAEVFPHVAVVAPPDYIALTRAGNFVLVGSNVPLDVSALEAAMPDGESILVDDDAVAWSAPGIILTDEFAPTDQLFQR
jgi:spermidine synthase